MSAKELKDFRPILDVLSDASAVEFLDGPQAIDGATYDIDPIGLDLQDFAKKQLVFFCDAYASLEDPPRGEDIELRWVNVARKYVKDHVAVKIGREKDLPRLLKPGHESMQRSLYREM